MNQIDDGKVKDIMCSEKDATSKKQIIKAKDSPNATDDVNIVNQDKLSDALSNNLHVNNINSNLTNGTCNHSPEDSLVKSLRSKDDENTALSESSSDVCNLDCSEAEIKRQASSTSQINIVRNLVEEALENLENALKLKTKDDIEIISYESELQMPEIMRLIQKDLSEPYSIYTYRYFIHNWPKLCFLATHEGKCIGAIVCKLDMHRNVVKRGYIAMLAVDKKYRKRKIGSRLVEKAIQAMINDNADEVVLETEITNKPALKLYENLGFVRDKRLFRYYLNGVDALRLKLWLRWRLSHEPPKRIKRNPLG